MRGSRDSPASTTARTPGTVRLDSATDVASTTLGGPVSRGRSTASWASAGARAGRWGTSPAARAAAVRWGPVRPARRPAPPPQLARAGQEAQHVTVPLIQRAPYGTGDVVEQ